MQEPSLEKSLGGEVRVREPFSSEYFDSIDADAEAAWARMLSLADSGNGVLHRDYFGTYFRSPDGKLPRVAEGQIVVVDGQIVYDT